MSTLNPRHKLGNLCRRGHDHEGTGQSMRLLSDGHCVVCQQERVRAHRAEISANEARRKRSRPYPRQTGIYLGALCSRGHEHEDTGQSLRRKDNCSCIVCLAMAGQTYRSQHAAANRAYQQAYRQRYPDRARLAARRYRASDLGRATMQEWLLRNPESGRQARLLGRRRRHARKMGVVRVPYSPADVAQLMDAYGGCCAYCGAIAVEMDHVVPLVLRGHDALYNLAPACRSCNASKYGTLLELWYPRQPFFSHERLVFMAAQHIAAGLPSMAVAL